MPTARPCPARPPARRRRLPAVPPGRDRAARIARRGWPTSSSRGTSSSTSTRTSTCRSPTGPRSSIGRSRRPRPTRTTPRSCSPCDASSPSSATGTDSCSGPRAPRAMPPAMALDWADDGKGGDGPRRGGGRNADGRGAGRRRDRRGRRQADCDVVRRGASPGLRGDRGVGPAPRRERPGLPRAGHRRDLRVHHPARRQGEGGAGAAVRAGHGRAPDPREAPGERVRRWGRPGAASSTST